MRTSTATITETMEELHRLFKTRLALNREAEDAEHIIRATCRERFGTSDPRAVLLQAEVNSLRRERDKIVRKARFVTTVAQGDLFNQQLLRVPAILIVNGQERPYYEASIIDGLEWWRSRADAKRTLADQLAEATSVRAQEADEADGEANKLQALVQAAQESGIDPTTVMYARAQAEEG